MPTYRLSNGALVPEFAKPIPLHAQTDGARAAVERMQRAGWDRVVEREVGRIVTAHGGPVASAWQGEVVTANARSLLALAEKCGFTAHLLTDDERCVVEGYRLTPRKEGFRATWLRGSAGGFAWCTPWRYELVEDKRSVGVNAVARVGKEGYRSPGVGTTRLAIAGTPWGLKVSWTELQRRVRAAADEVPS